MNQRIIKFHCPVCGHSLDQIRFEGNGIRHQCRWCRTKITLKWEIELEKPQTEILKESLKEKYA